MADLVFTVILLGALQGAVLAAVLASRKTNRLANRFLAALVGGLALMLVLGYCDQRWGWHGHPHLLALGTPLPFLFAPLLFLYIAALTRPLERLEARQLVHALPFVADVIFMTHGFFLKSGPEKLAIASDYVAGRVTLSVDIVDGLELLQAVAYLVASYVALRRYARKMRGYYSDLTRIDLRWLLAIVLGQGAVWSIVIVRYFLRQLGLGAPSAAGIGVAVPVASVLVLFLIGYISIWQPELFDKAKAAQSADLELDVELREVSPPEPSASRGSPIAATPAAPTESREPAESGESGEASDGVPGGAEQDAAPRYQRNRLEDDEAEAIAVALRGLMGGTSPPYRDAALTAQMLADELGITPHLLSQVLNVRIGKSFYAFVNGYRVEAVKVALADPDARARGILELAFEAGFNSKSTLNSFFKKQTGMTPSEFRKRAHASGS